MQVIAQYLQCNLGFKLPQNPAGALTQEFTSGIPCPELPAGLGLGFRPNDLGRFAVLTMVWARRSAAPLIQLRLHQNPTVPDRRSVPHEEFSSSRRQHKALVTGWLPIGHSSGLAGAGARPDPLSARPGALANANSRSLCRASSCEPRCPIPRRPVRE